MRGFYQDTVARLRPALVDDGHGNEVPDWSGATSTDITSCRFQPLSSDEVVTGRDLSDVRFRLLAPVDVDLTLSDRVVYDSVTYEVWGSPLRHRSPRGSAEHAEVLLRRVDG